MKYKAIVYNSITVSLPKNIIQFLVGIVLYWIIIGPFNYIKAFIGLVAFLITYSSVYIMNDIIDYEEDRKDKLKKEWKIIANGTISIKDAVALLVFMLVVGFSLSLIVGVRFTIAMILLIFLNFLHSSPFTKFKKRIKRTVVNMTTIEFIKYSSGWFALTTNISYFPFWLILCLALAYTFSYITYKFKLDISWVKKHRLLFSFMLSLASLSYILSLMMYDFPVSLLILLIFPVAIFMLAKRFKWEARMKNMLFLEYILLPIIIISFLVLMNPAINSMNESLHKNIVAYKDALISKIPRSLISPVENISEEIKNRYKTLDDIKNDINSTIPLEWLYESS